MEIIHRHSIHLILSILCLIGAFNNFPIFVQHHKIRRNTFIDVRSFDIFQIIAQTDCVSSLWFSYLIT